MTRQRDDVAGLEATIIMSPEIWKASGHVDNVQGPDDMQNLQRPFSRGSTNEIPCPQKPSKCSMNATARKPMPVHST